MSTRVTDLDRDREQTVKNSPHIKHFFWGHEATETGPAVSLIPAICFSQHIVIALCSSIDFVLNPGLSQKLTASTPCIPLHLHHHLAFPRLPPHPPQHMSNLFIVIDKLCGPEKPVFFHLVAKKNILRQWLMNNSNTRGWTADGISLRASVKQLETGFQ